MAYENIFELSRGETSRVIDFQVSGRFYFGLGTSPARLVIVFVDL